MNCIDVSRQSSKSLGKHASKLSGCGLVALDEAGESQSTQHEQFEAETGQEVPQGTGGSKEEDQTDFTNVDLKPKGSEDREVCSEETTGQELSSPIHAVDSSHVDSSHQPLPPPLPLTPPPPAVGEEHSGKALTDSFSEHDGNSLTLGDRSSSRSPSLPPIGSGFGRGKIKFSFKGGPLSSSLQSLPTSFSPVVTPAATPSKFLGYNPMMVCQFKLFILLTPLPSLCHTPPLTIPHTLSSLYYTPSPHSATPPPSLRHIPSPHSTTHPLPHSTTHHSLTPPHTPHLTPPHTLSSLRHIPLTLLHHIPSPHSTTHPSPHSTYHPLTPPHTPYFTSPHTPYFTSPHTPNLAPPHLTIFLLSTRFLC